MTSRIRAMLPCILLAHTPELNPSTPSSQTLSPSRFGCISSPCCLLRLRREDAGSSRLSCRGPNLDPFDQNRNADSSQAPPPARRQRAAQERRLTRLVDRTTHVAGSA